MHSRRPQSLTRMLECKYFVRKTALEQKMEEHCTFTYYNSVYVAVFQLCVPAFTKPFIKSFLSFSSPTSLIALSPLIPLPGKLNHSFSVCFLSSTPLYAHRLAPSLMTFPRRFSEDIERGGRKRAFLSNKRKGDWRMWKAPIQASSEGLGAATSSGGRRGCCFREGGLGILDRGQERCRGSSDDAGPWERPVSPPLLCPLGHRLRTPHILFTCTNKLSPQFLYPKSRLQGEECVSINRAVRLSQRLMSGMSRFLKGTAVTYSHLPLLIHWQWSHFLWYSMNLTRGSLFKTVYVVHAQLYH